MILNKKTGQRIRKLLADSGIPVREVQEKLGLESPQAVYKWLNGKSLPTLENALSLSRILGVSLEDILIFDENSLVRTGRNQEKLDRPAGLPKEKEWVRNDRKRVKGYWRRQLPVYMRRMILNPSRFQELARQIKRKL